MQKTEAFLAHYGVKGMKWGVRKDGKTRQEVRNAKSQKYTDRAAKIKTKMDKLNKKGTYSAELKRQDLGIKRNLALKDAELKKQGKLSTKQKKVAIGAAVVGGLLVARAVYITADSGNFNRLATKGKEFVTKEKFSWTKKESLASPNLNAKEIHDRVVRQVNPAYGQLGTKTNCRRATLTYEMRRRGHDVTATRTLTATGQNPSGMVNMFSPGAKQKPLSQLGTISTIGKETFQKARAEAQGKKAYTPVLNIARGEIPVTTLKGGGTRLNSISLFETLKKQPNGSRGEVQMSFGTLAGHSMAYEIVRGVPVIFDTQNSKMMVTPEDFTKATKGLVTGLGVTRLDNKVLNDEMLLRWMKNAN